MKPSTTKREKERIIKHISNLGNQDDGKANRAEVILIRVYGVKALDELIEASNDNNPQVRLRIAMILGSTKESGAFNTIMKLTEDNHPHVRYDAVIALGNLGDERSVEPLIKKMSVPDPAHSIDDAAAMGLTKLGIKAVNPLLSSLQSMTGSVQRTALHVLGHIGDPSVIQPISGFLFNEDPYIRLSAIEALAAIGNQDSINIIEHHIPHEPNFKVRENAMNLIELIKPKLN